MTGAGPRLVLPGTPTPRPTKSALQMPIDNQQLQQMAMQQGALLQRAKLEVERLNQENASLATKTQHFIGLLICILREHHSEGVKFPMKLMNDIPGDLGINSSRIDATDEILVELMTQEQMMFDAQNLVQGDQVFSVPRKSPFKFKLAIPDDGTFAGIRSIQYTSGKIKGTALSYVPGKPKKIREFTCDEKGEITFSTDSAGQEVRAVFIFKVKEEREDSAAGLEEPLECKGEWHKKENNGVDVVGLCCPQCGDRRKLIPA